MRYKQLSPEIVSLIHHVELNESGWWKKAISQVIKGVLWAHKSPQSIPDLRAALKAELGIVLPDDTIGKQLDALISQGIATKFGFEQYKLTEKARQDLTLASQQASAEEQKCKESFLKSCEAHCPDLDAKSIWSEFSTALADAIRTTGANLFHLLEDGNLEREEDWLSRFHSKFDRRWRAGLKQVLVEFFDHQNVACRNQVLRLLSAHFFAEASQLRPETLKLIEGERKARTIRIVLDTNFIFSLLGLHDNPGDDAVASLVDIAGKAKNTVNIKLYVLPGTLDEAQRTLAHQLQLVERIRSTQPMARAALTQPLPSIAKKYFEAAAKTAGLSAQSYFQPYIDELRTILRGKGISVLEAHPSVYNIRQDVIDDVIDEQKREEAEIPEKKRKGYETLLHDAVLWHAVNDKRASSSDSPFDVEYWAVSIDWRLISFDRKKRLTTKASIPVVLHPTNLVQLVQFWVPRSEELERSLIDSLRLPLYFQGFDPEDERATVRVLEAISRFENVGDLPEDTLKLVLANQALRGKLREADASNDEVFALVREQLLEEHRLAVAELQASRDEAKAKSELLETERSGKQAVIEELAVAQQRAQAAEQLAQREAESRSRLEARLQESERGTARGMYLVYFFVLPLVLGIVLGVYGSANILELWPNLNTAGGARWIQYGLASLPVALGLLLSPFYTRNRQYLTGWKPVTIVEFIGAKGILAPLSMLSTAIIQGGAWDWFKSVTGISF